MVQDVSPSTTLRVAFVTGGLQLGGATTFLCNLAGELVRRNVAVKVLSFEKENPFASDFKKLKIPLSCTDEHRSIFEDRMQSVLLELKNFKPSVVVANLGSTSFETLRYGPPGVFRMGVVHADDPNVYKVIVHYAPYLDLLAVVSEAIKTNLEKMPEFSGVPVRYLPLGVPMLSESSLATRVTSPALRILYIGRLCQEQKRVRLFPSIFEKLKSSGIPFSWTIAGEGPEKSYLERAMKSDNPNQTVFFAGKIAYTDVPQLLREQDIFLLASDYEGLPLSLLEAMGQGVVPVVSDLSSGIGELVDDTNGKRVAPENIAGYSDAIIWLHQHRDELERLSRNAREKVFQTFSVSAMADRWISAFLQAKPHPTEWPPRWPIQPLLLATRPFYYSPLVRIFRRLALKFRRPI